MDLNNINLLDIQPSQFYISQKKLKGVQTWFSKENLSAFDPLPVKLLQGRLIFTDGHTRALAAHLAGLRRVPLQWDEDDLDWEQYQACVDACIARGVRSVADLAGRVLTAEAYRQKWDGWCDVMQEVFKLQRQSGEKK